MKTIVSAILMVVFSFGFHAQNRLEIAKKTLQKTKNLFCLIFPVQTGVFPASSFIKTSSKQKISKNWNPIK
jgi:hypothetical protein